MRNEPRIEFAPLFNRQRKEAPLEIEEAFLATLELFLENPNHEALRDHPLTGRYAGFRSVDVTEDWRALYRKERERIVFAYLGTHDELYG